MKKFESLSKEQMKQAKGGVELTVASIGDGGNVNVCGTLWSCGQCYCDFCDRETFRPVSCGVPCGGFFCGH